MSTDTRAALETAIEKELRVCVEMCARATAQDVSIDPAIKVGVAHLIALARSAPEERGEGEVADLLLDYLSDWASSFERGLLIVNVGEEEGPFPRTIRGGPGVGDTLCVGPNENAREALLDAALHDGSNDFKRALQAALASPPAPVEGEREPVIACPVCGGRGNMPAGFYSPFPSMSTSAAPTETCRTCWGSTVYTPAALASHPVQGAGGGRSFGVALREARVAAGLSLRDAASQLGVTVTHLGAVERGLPAPSHTDLMISPEAIDEALAYTRRAMEEGAGGGEWEESAEPWLPEPRMIVCPVCGNKRCPHARNPRFACTGSNEPDQIGIVGPSPVPYRVPTTYCPAHGTRFWCEPAGDEPHGYCSRCASPAPSEEVKHGDR